MSRFSYTYAPLIIVKLQHESELEAAKYVTIYPNEKTAQLIEKHKLVVKIIPEGFVVLFKKQEEFVAETVDEVLVIDGVEVTDKRIVGYASTLPDRTFSNWLPQVIDIDLEFYAKATQKYRENTAWNDLALDEFVVYNAGDLEGTVSQNTNIRERTQPDAIFQLNIQEANITTPVTLTFEVNLNT
ncbi:hypothetical protein [Kordia zhangzhouensis]|uniref:hypothetical protein n=1 Tax=Kordia zhangzhouensis TaxID=1620405 RepID=UPI000629498D|nr:hypothetical protein [Kordia zhangzhouensis]